jgi:hypothetical protein
MHESPAGRREVGRAFDKVEEGLGYLFTGGGGHGQILIRGR